MDPAFSQFEIRFVSSEEDKVVRRVSEIKILLENYQLQFMMLKLMRSTRQQKALVIS